MSQLVLLLVLVAGALGLLLAMPGRRTDLGRAGMILLLAAAGGGLYAAARYAAGGAPLAAFIVCALVALFGAVRVITHPRPVYSALYFVLLVAAVTGLLVLMQAEFLAAALLLVYAGAILVTYIFVIMLAQQARLAPYDARAREPLLGVLAGFVLLAALAGQIGSDGLAAEPGATDRDAAGAGLVAAGGMDADETETAVTGDAAADEGELAAADGVGEQAADAAGQAAGTVEHVGTPLLTEYIIGIEIAGVLLTAAMIGAIAIARRRPQLALGPEPFPPAGFEPGFSAREDGAC